MTKLNRSSSMVIVKVCRHAEAGYQERERESRLVARLWLKLELESLTLQIFDTAWSNLHPQQKSVS